MTASWRARLVAGTTFAVLALAAFAVTYELTGHSLRGLASYACVP